MSDLSGKLDATITSTAATRKVQRKGLIGRGVVGLLGLAWKLFILPISITSGIIRLITCSIRLGFWLAGSVLSYSLSIIGLTRSVRHQKSPQFPPLSVSLSAAAEEETKAVDFLSEFERQYGKIHPNFVRMGFTEAVKQSRREFKLMFVYLHSPDHPDTPSFCKETLCSEVLSTFVNENFVSWGDSINAIEGLKISKSLNASKFPFLAVIMAAIGQSISLLRQFEGPASPEQMLKELQIVLEESESALVAARISTDGHRKNTQLKEEPDPDALESNQAEEDQKQQEREAEFAQWCKTKPLSLGPEPDTGPDVTQVLVRLPNGERKGRRFNCNDTLQSVYDFVDSSGCLEIGSYTLVTFFPRVLYGEDELSSTLEELGLYPQASLFVELNS